MRKGESCPIRRAAAAPPAHDGFTYPAAGSEAAPVPEALLLAAARRSVPKPSMVREIRPPRPDWKPKVEAYGLIFHTFEGKPYWNEAAAYRFTRSEIEELETATNALHELCLQAVEHVIRHRQYGRLHIPEPAWSVIESAWDQDPPAIYGRFDLAYDGTTPPKMLEFNADTPTSLLEAAVIQWHWLQEVEPSADQFNSIWEALVQKWSALKEERLLKDNLVHFACGDVMEDLMTTAVMMDTAQEAGLHTHHVELTQIGFDTMLGCFIDERMRPMHSIFKLYPWEWMLEDPFGRFALESYPRHHWIEPIWKMVLSNKGILPILWEMFPEHPNLLPAYDDSPRGMPSYVSKPILGREGANVSLVTPSETTVQTGDYGDQPMIFQKLAGLPDFDGNHALIGSWVIDCAACGIGVRESDTPITTDLARFVPHYFSDEDN
jgi:glutathionylspermidine synthase